MARDSFVQTPKVAAILCIVCSVVVSGAAVGLRGRQEANKLKDQRKNVLIAAGKFVPDENTLGQVNEIFSSSIVPILVDLETGKPVPADEIDPSSYDPRKAASNPDMSEPVDPPTGLGGIKRREKYAFVYQVKSESGEIERVVLPVYGKGLWSTLYGFLAINKDGVTVDGITFYQHGETPGLGGEVDNPGWKSKWSGKKLYDSGGDILLELIKGSVTDETPNAEYKVDGLTGATITTNGVEELVRYWVGPDGFGPYLDQLREENEGGSDG